MSITHVKKEWIYSSLIDTTGQIDYYYKNKKYVGDQLSFALDGMSKPVHDLLMITGCQL